ncbi:hypothetical protein BD410DRAFT_846379 [Rickenella mellea]|uniref:Ricin B lectin domain-containing protein n=1 Tax=Rickenella mellea TaxID=50990 RepID=A0A4Y7PI34_9AGAM|nr:hypothetical protein BD410DRAFT_846379 [Rickenella mellea]
MSKATIPTGTYVIENVDRCNDVFLADDGRALVAGSSDADADPPSESCWKLTRLRNGRYLIRHAEQQNRYACWPVGFCQGSEVVTSPTPHHWVVTEAKVKETYVISHARCQLYWGIEDDEEGRPVSAPESNYFRRN